MTKPEKKVITVEAKVNAPVEKVWKLWTAPEHIIQWNNASDDWHTPKAENDLRVGGKFLSRMEARDGSAGFDFTGKYNKIELHKSIDYTMDDGRKVHITFDTAGKGTKITQSFEAEHTNSFEMQHTGWQAILDNFKNYSEKSERLELIHFEITINSSAEKVYKTVIDEKTYPEWTAEFNPSSHFEGSWDKGSTMLFLGTDKDGSTGGMVSKIRENIPNRFISIEHVGIVQKGKELKTGPEVETWSGALEKYTFKESEGATLFSVDQHSSREFKSYFQKIWPKALNKLKLICEKK